MLVFAVIGTDIKSLAINFASIMLLILPIVIYMDQTNAKKYVGAVIGFFILAFIAPPLGWKRPHPYSDDPANKPYSRKQE